MGLAHATSVDRMVSIPHRVTPKACKTTHVVCPASCQQMMAEKTSQIHSIILLVCFTILFCGKSPLYFPKLVQSENNKIH